ncbi:MAG TPA: hypothetical protein VF170_08645, partial [Planctomycetaceae bacterium]
MPRSAPARPLLVWLSSAFLLTVAVAGCESSSPPPEAQADAAPAEEASEDPASKAPAEPATSETAKPGETETGGDTPPPPADVLPSPAETAATDGEKPQAAPRQLPPGADPLVPEGVTRETTEGWWRIVFSVNGNDYSAGFVRIGKDEGGAFKVEEVRTNDIINPAKPVQTDATAETVHIAFRHEDNEFDYVGALDGNVIRGNLQFEHPRQNLVRLVPVKDSDVTDAALDRQELGTTFGVEPVVTALQSDTPAEELGKIADTWRNSPMLYMAYDVLFAQAKKLGLDRPALERMAEEFEKTGRVWGERAEQAAKLNIATGLLFAGHEIDLGRRKLGEAKAEAPELVEAWGELLAVAERVAAVEEARRQVAEGQV